MTTQSSGAVADVAAAAVAFAEDHDATVVQPDAVTSTNNNTEDFTFLFDEE
jgi:hypothetical protein